MASSRPDATGHPQYPSGIQYRKCLVAFLLLSLILAYKEFCGTIAVLVTGWGEITNNNLYCILLYIARPFLYKDTFNKHISLFVILS